MKREQFIEINIEPLTRIQQRWGKRKTNNVRKYKSLRDFRIKRVKIHMIGFFERKAIELGRDNTQNDGTFSCNDQLTYLDRLSC